MELGLAGWKHYLIQEGDWACNRLLPVQRRQVDLIDEKRGEGAVKIECEKWSIEIGTWLTSFQKQVDGVVEPDTFFFQIVKLREQLIQSLIAI